MKTSKQINSEIIARLKAAGFNQDEHGSQTYSKFDDRLLIVKFSTRNSQTTFECSAAGVETSFTTLDECFDFFDQKFDWDDPAQRVAAYLEGSLKNFDDDTDDYDDDLEHTSSKIPEDPRYKGEFGPLHESLEQWKADPLPLPVSMVEVEGKRYPIISAAKHDKQQAAIDALRNGVEAVKAFEAAGYSQNEWIFKKDLTHAKLVISAFEMGEFRWHVHKTGVIHPFASGRTNDVHAAIEKAEEAALEIDSEYDQEKSTEHVKLVCDKLSGAAILFITLCYIFVGYAVYQQQQDYFFVAIATFIIIMLYASGIIFAMGLACSYFIRVLLGLPVEHLIGSPVNSKEGE